MPRADLYPDVVYGVRPPHVPLHRVGELDAIAKVALFLANIASDYIIGDTIVVKGDTCSVKDEMVYSPWNLWGNGMSRQLDWR